MAESSDFLINLAIIKINWDSNHDILDNFMPIAAYAISKLDNEVVSITELKRIIEDVARFKIPSGALEVLIRRASKPKYGYVIRRDKTYKKVSEKLKNITFEKDRSAATNIFNQMSVAFDGFCEEKFPTQKFNDSAQALFEILYDFAPKVVTSATSFIGEEINKTTSETLTLRYRAARFISDAISLEKPYLSSIEAFVQGAVLAESFYYNSPDAVQHRFRDIKVYYDTNLLSKILGYSSSAEVEAARELHDLVLKSNAKTCIFEHTREELHRIFTAASFSRRSGPLRAARPGDIFDWLNLHGYSTSDIDLELAKIPGKLEDESIRVEASPGPDLENQIDELNLKAHIREEIPNINQQAINADVDSLQAIFRLRRGLAQPYLDSCKAILVTTNKSLASASTRYFNREHAISDAPVCITDHVFCMLLWLKTVDKKENIPRELMVANCVAALQPSRELWDRYMSEVEKLRQRGDVSEEDYALLAHSVEARQVLMDITAADPETFTIGGAVEVLSAAKDAITAEAKNEIRQRSEEINKLKFELEIANN